MFKQLWSRIIDRNHSIALEIFQSRYGAEHEFTQRRIQSIGDGRFKIYDPHTSNEMFFVHRIFGPVIDEI